MQYIEEHLTDPIRLEDVARAASFSPFHFHRIFKSVLGETLNELIVRLRLERAANKLAQNARLSITEVALECGFSSSATFARSFKKHFGLSASEWRTAEYERQSKIGKSASKTGQTLRSGGEGFGKGGKAVAVGTAYDWRIVVDGSHVYWRNAMEKQIEVKEMPAHHVAYIRHVGPYNQIGGAFERLMQWAIVHQLMEPNTICLGIYHDDPSITAPEKLRSDACLAVPTDQEPDGEIGIRDIPAGRYAVMRTEVTADEIHGAWEELINGWMPESGFQPDDRPCYEIYLNNPKEHPEGKFIMDICEPVRPL